MDTQEPVVQTEDGISRRRFFQRVIGFLSALATLTLAIPFIAALIGPALEKRKTHFAKVAALDSLPLGEPVDVKYADLSTDAFMSHSSTYSVWIIKHSPTKATAFSPICPHLGCGFNWDAQARRFACPCHGSVWTIDGRVIGGPSPRPLDTLPTKIQNGELYVELLRFKTGIPQKIGV